MKLLVPVDITQPADLMELAAYTARRLGAEIHLLAVIGPGRVHGTVRDEGIIGVGSPPPASDSMGGLIPPVTSKVSYGLGGIAVETRSQAIDRAETEVRDRLNLLKVQLPGVAVTTAVVLDKHPAAAISSYAARHSVDLLLMRTHAHTGLQRAVFGSVAEAVVRSVEVPVLLAGPAYPGNTEPQYDELVVCLDGTGTAEEMLPAAAWVSALPMQVTIATAVASERWPSESAGNAEYLESVASQLQKAGASITTAVIRGLNPAAAIVSYAAVRPRAIIALVTHARSGLPRLVQGSVAMQVLHNAHNPVLLLHAQPAGIRVRLEPELARSLTF